jgi:hypothetical protein
MNNPTNKYQVIYCDKTGPVKTRYMTTNAVKQNFRKKTTVGFGVAWGRYDEDILFFIFDETVGFHQLSEIIHSVIDNIPGLPHMGFTAKTHNRDHLND